MTYTSLLQTLEDYLQRSDALVLSEIPNFIMLAQRRIPREMKILGFRTEVQGQFDATATSTGVMAKPADWQKTMAFYIGTGISGNTFTPLFDRTVEYMRTIYPDPTSNGTPRFYGDIDYNHWMIAPTPATALYFRIVYYQIPAMLDATVQTNWLTEYTPDLLLYACLLEAQPFLKDDERIPVWQALYSQAKAALQAQEGENKNDSQAVTNNPQPASSVPR